MVRWLIDSKTRSLNTKLTCRGRLSRDKKCRSVFGPVFTHYKKNCIPSPPFIYFLPISPLPSFPTLLILESVKFFVICFIPVNRGYIKTRAPGTLMGRLQDLAWWFSPFLTSRINSRAPNPDDFPCKTLMKPYPS